jgi:hypothetical protein
MTYPSPQRVAPGEQGGVRATLSLLSGSAAAIHFAVIGDHFDEYWAFGAFFLVIAWFQAAWAVLVVAYPSRPLMVIGAIVNGAIVAVWLWSRTAGLPIGPEAGEPEVTQFIDVVATVAEFLLVVGCLAMLRPWRFVAVLTARSAAALFVVAALLTVGTTSWALVVSSVEEGSHEAEAEEDAPEGHDED